MPLLNREMEQCIDNCMECYRVCIRTKMHCMEKGGSHADTEHLGIMADCAKMCAVSADFMLRDSNRHHQVCGLCATFCELCANNCNQLADDDEDMRMCAQVCTRCAESCHQMAGIAV